MKKEKITDTKLDKKIIEKLEWELIGYCNIGSGQILLIDPMHILNEIEWNYIMKKGKPPIKFRGGIIENTGGIGNYHIYVHKNNKRVEQIIIDLTTIYEFDKNKKQWLDIDLKKILEESEAEFKILLEKYDTSKQV